MKNALGEISNRLDDEEQISDLEYRVIEITKLKRKKIFLMIG